MFVWLQPFSLNIDSYRSHANSNIKTFNLNKGMRAVFLHSTINKYSIGSGVYGGVSFGRYSRELVK